MFQEKRLTAKSDLLLFATLILIQEFNLNFFFKKKKVFLI